MSSHLLFISNYIYMVCNLFLEFLDDIKIEKCFTEHKIQICHQIKDMVNST